LRVGMALSVCVCVCGAWRGRRSLGGGALEGARGLQGGRGLDESGALRVGPV